MAFSAMLTMIETTPKTNATISAYTHSAVPMIHSLVATVSNFASSFVFSTSS